MIGLGFMLHGCSTINVEGRISRVGNEPFSYLAVEDMKTKESYKVLNNVKYEKYQGQIKNLKIKIIKKSDIKLIPSEIEIISIK